MISPPYCVECAKYGLKVIAETRLVKTHLDKRKNLGSFAYEQWLPALLCSWHRWFTKAYCNPSIYNVRFLSEVSWKDYQKVVKREGYKVSAPPKEYRMLELI